MVTVQSLDVRGLQFLIGGLQNALIATGGDLQTVVPDESKLLAVEISKLVGPKDRSKTGARIEKSVRSKFTALGQNTEDRFGRVGTTGVTWYRCDKGFLFGTAPDSDMRKASGETLANIYYASKRVQGKTRIVTDFKHPRHHQRVAITTKVLTTKGAVNRAIVKVKEAIGKLKASWFATGKMIDPALVGPQWIERHIKNNRTTKSIIQLAGLQNLQSPSVTFGSRAVGVGKFGRVIQFAVKVREKKVAARLKLILSGYSKDVAKGIRIQRHGKDKS